MCESCAASALLLTLWANLRNTAGMAPSATAPLTTSLRKNSVASMNSTASGSATHAEPTNGATM